MRCGETLTGIWSPLGQIPLGRLSPSREPRHCYGALDGRAGSTSALTTTQETSLITANFWLFPTQPFLLDRAPCPFGADIHPLVADPAPFHGLFFPPTCPELNPQPPVWEPARPAIAHTHAYAPFPTLIDAFASCRYQTPCDRCFTDKYAPPFFCHVYFVSPQERNIRGQLGGGLQPI